MFGGFPTFSLPDLPAFNDTLTKLQEDVKHNLEHVSLGDTSTIAEGGTAEDAGDATAATNTVNGTDDSTPEDAAVHEASSNASPHAPSTDATTDALAVDIGRQPSVDAPQVDTATPSQPADAIVEVVEADEVGGPSPAEASPRNHVDGPNDGLPSSTAAIAAAHDPEQTALLEAAAAVADRDAPCPPIDVQPLADLQSMDAPALRELATVLHEALEARQQQLLRHADELSTSKQVVRQLAAKNQELACRTAKLSEADYEELRVEAEERLAVAERRVYALTKERDALRRGTEKLTSANELLKAKDDMIKDLMEEGEKLAMKQLEHENTIKKLRQQVESMGRERSRLAGVSGQQASKLEALSGEKAMLEAQIQTMLEHHRQALDNERRHAAEQVAAAKRAQADASSAAASCAREGAASQLRETQAQLVAAEHTIMELQQALEENRMIAHTREDALKAEVADLQARCQEAQLRHEELAAKLPETTGPLVRQLEALQAAATEQAAAWQHSERALVARATEAEGRAAAASQRERVMQSRLVEAETAAAAAQGALDAAREEIAALQLASARHTAAMEATTSQVAQLEAALMGLRREGEQALADKMQVVGMLEQQVESLQAHNAGLASKVRDLEDRATTAGLRGGLVSTPNPPALAGPGYKWVLVKQGEHSVNGDAQPAEIQDAPGLPMPVSQSSTSSQLAMLQQQVAGLEATRGRLSSELVQATGALEAAAAAQAEAMRLRQQVADMQSEHAACIELLGEKEEALEEALADLEDVKEVVKQQVLLITECIERGAMSPDVLKSVKLA